MWPDIQTASPIFQFTPLREGRPSLVWAVRYEIKFQFTPLREGRRIIVGRIV